MMLFADGALVSGWFSITLAGVTMLFIAAHVLAIQKLDMPASRRRVRTAAGVLMLMLCAMLAYATGLVSPDENREFVLAWMAVMALLGMVLLLAGLDVLNTLRLHRHARTKLRRLSQDELTETSGAASLPGPSPDVPAATTKSGPQ